MGLTGDRLARLLDDAFDADESGGDGAAFTEAELRALCRALDCSADWLLGLPGTR